jgi:hypothetical protein
MESAARRKPKPRRKPKAKTKVKTGQQLDVQPRWLNGAATDRYLGITAMTRWRWMHDPKVKFPKPKRIRRHNYFYVPDLDAFMRTYGKENAA